MRGERDLADGAPLTHQPAGTVRAGGDERGVAQHARAQPADRRRQRSVDVLGALHAKRHAHAPEHPAPLRGDERERLGLEEGDIRTCTLGEPAAAGQVEVPLRAPAQRHRHAPERVLEAVEHLRLHVPQRVLAAPAARQHDRHLPAAAVELQVDLLVDAHHRRMADDEQPSASARGLVARACTLKARGVKPIGARAHRPIVARELARARAAGL